MKKKTKKRIKELESKIKNLEQRLFICESKFGTIPWIPFTGYEKENPYTPIYDDDSTGDPPLGYNPTTTGTNEYKPESARTEI